ncbi:hypothetical protein OI25_3696 [Paraburkholderia fungorum]|uniref:Uncharacterized protein n=1 Tax=Paraburkholderia fungorum TaxID=134537 RepID=A0AAU8T0R7_9BURK|nr:hypothetical protein OI25_3696 [Paraburkholderia fungorum]PRZ46067.1 hypothetical protein BX589_13557 [Paraburkholderia fungorum]
MTHVGITHVDMTRGDERPRIISNIYYLTDF